MAANFTVKANATPAATFTEAGQLPSGVQLNPDGTLTGTPAAGTEGTYPVTVTASNGIAPDDTQPLTLTVGDLPNFTSPDSATFVVGKAGIFAVEATGDPTPTVTEEGALPFFLTFQNGTLEGTPAAGTGGSYSINFAADNGLGDTSQLFTLNIDQAAAITSADHAAFSASVRNTFTIRTTGFPAARLRERGHLPAGVRFVAERDGRAKLVGVPARFARGRSYVITIIASNAVGHPARQTFTLRIRRHRG
jgi:large repetitive protein